MAEAAQALAERIRIIRNAAINENKARDLKLALRYGIPTTLVETAYLSNSLVSRLDIDFNIAALEFSPYDCNILPFCTLLAKPFIADALAKEMTTTGVNITSDQTLAMKFSILTGLPLEFNQVTNREVIAARDRVYQVLRKNKPPVPILTRSVEYIINQCRAAQDGQGVEGIEAVKVCPFWQSDLLCPAQKHAMYARRGHNLPLQLLASQLTRDVFIRIIDEDGLYVDMTNLDLAPDIDEDQYAAIWNTLTNEEMVGVFDMIGACNVNDAMNNLYAAIFCYVASVGKASFTDEWVNRRLDQFVIEVPTNNLKNLVKANMLTQYAKKVKRDITDKAMFYGKIHALMTLAAKPNLT